MACVIALEGGATYLPVLIITGYPLSILVILFDRIGACVSDPATVVS
jgi:hypothetical protein